MPQSNLRFRHFALSLKYCLLNFPFTKFSCIDLIICIRKFVLSLLPNEPQISFTSFLPHVSLAEGRGRDGVRTSHLLPGLHIQRRFLLGKGKSHLYLKWYRHGNSSLRSICFKSVSLTGWGYKHWIPNPNLSWKQRKKIWGGVWVHWTHWTANKTEFSKRTANSTPQPQNTTLPVMIVSHHNDFHASLFSEVVEREEETNLSTPCRRLGFFGKAQRHYYQIFTSELVSIHSSCLSCRNCST